MSWQKGIEIALWFWISSTEGTLCISDLALQKLATDQFLLYSQAEIRRRLWASILEMNLQASLDSGAPLALSYDEFDTESPSNVNDCDFDEDAKFLPCHPETTTTDSSLQRLLLKNLKLRMEILSKANALEPVLPLAQVRSITSQLVKACHDCGTHLPDGIEQGARIFRCNFANLLLRRFLLTLHRPLTGGVHTQHPDAYFSRRVCIDAASALVTPPPNPEFSHLESRGGGMFKHSNVHASLAVCSELLLDLEEHGQLQWPSFYRGMLINALHQALEKAAGRVRQGETNVRLHMKLSVALCLAKSTETGVDLRERMAQAAKQSLEQSCAAIQSYQSFLSTASDGGVDAPAESIDQEDLCFPVDLDLGSLLDIADFGLDSLF